MRWESNGKGMVEGGGGTEGNGMERGGERHKAG